MTDDLEHHRITPVVKALLVAVAVTILLLAAFYLESTRRADDLDRKADALSASLEARAVIIDELAAGQDVMRAQLEEADIEPAVPDPSVTIREVVRETGATGAQGLQGVAGISGRDGRDGITPACWFEQSQCRGAKGDRGDVGPGPTFADLDAAILRYCATNQCKGDQGAPGADSTVPGPIGPQGPPGPPTECEPGHQWVTVQIQGDDYRVCAPTGAP